MAGLLLALHFLGPFFVPLFFSYLYSMTVLELKDLIFELPDDMEVFILDTSSENIDLIYTDKDGSGLVEMKGIIREEVFAIAILTEDDQNEERLN